MVLHNCSCGLIGITSLGIYGFLSDAYDDTRSKLEMHENNIETLNKEIVVIETEIENLKIQMLH